ncbi:putative quinol monooxygenase [Ideonella sp. A 288]|uniref:putative quinol monooxygenase n=1 Tax=Ideonella sp. A 288 TaxID=1962181 RepID=UPI000B4C1240|nr:putative quinol monooxygenase [Ideonella sp. A 288]
MEVLVVEFHIHPPRVAAFAQAIADNARASLESEHGCRQFDVCRDPADEGCFFLYELYDDEAAVQAHLQSPHFLQMNTQTAGWVASKQVWRYRRMPLPPGAVGKPAA